MILCVSSLKALKASKSEVRDQKSVVSLTPGGRARVSGLAMLCALTARANVFQKETVVTRHRGPLSPHRAGDVV